VAQQLGVLATAAVALTSVSLSAALWASGAAVIAGAIAMQDSPPAGCRPTWCRCKWRRRSVR
jgi:hypothetical protein